MIQNTCLEIHTEKFPILEGENDEVVNDGMYGKAICQYLKSEISKNGLEVPFFIAEDWGWWLEVKDGEFVLGLQIYSDSDRDENPEKYAIMSSITEDKKWSWRKFKKIDISNNVNKIMVLLENLLIKDPEVKSVIRHNEFPF